MHRIVVQEEKWKTNFTLEFHDSVAPDTKRLMVDMARMIVQLQDALTDLAVNNKVKVYNGDQDVGA